MEAQVTPDRSRTSGSPEWQRFEVRQIEDLANAVFGGDLDVIQMPGPRVGGGLAFTARDGVVFSSGLIEGHVTLTGPLSPDQITIGIGLRFGANSRLCLRPARDGDVGVVLPGEAHDASLTTGSLYVAATLSAERLNQEAKRQGLVLSHCARLQTGLRPQPIAGAALAALTHEVARLHRRRYHQCDKASDVGTAMLQAALHQFAEGSVAIDAADRRSASDRHAQIVARARAHIIDHLATALTIDALACAVETSARTLWRAFVEVLDDTPSGYIRRLRLHRIRRELSAPNSAVDDVAAIAARWGMSDAGRMAIWYRELFGELPGITRSAARARWRDVDVML